MKEVLARGDSGVIKTTIHDVPIPTPSPSQVVIRNIVVGTNPKDWKIPILAAAKLPKEGINSGDDVSGYVHAVGSNVTAFHKGDRVMAFHTMMTPHGAFAEYTVAEAHTTAHIPAEMGFEEAATFPLAALTAAVGLYARLGLPEPWGFVHPAREASKGGVVVYGAASAVGAFVVKLLVAADVHPIIAVAGKGIGFVEGMVDKGKGDVIVDYREGNEKVVEGIRRGVPEGRKLVYAYDAVSEHNSYQNICEVLDHQEGHITLVLPGKQFPEIPKSVNQTITTVGSVHGTPDHLEHLGSAWMKLFGSGIIKAHPYEVVPGGLAGVETGLNNLREGKASAIKYLYRVEETEGVERSRI